MSLTVSRNMPPQRPGLSRQDVQTPANFLAAVKKRLGITEFVRDLAASSENTAADEYFSIENDALTQSWQHQTRGWQWLNPEFNDLVPWLAKAAIESALGAHIVVLVPAGVGANWYRDHVNGKAYVLLLNGRLKFVGHKDFYPKDCLLLVYGPERFVGSEVWTWGERKDAIAPPRQRAVRVRKSHVEQ